MYQVSKHAHGRPTVRIGPMAGCQDFPQHKWLDVGRLRSKQAAIDLAKSQTVHCVVVVADTCNKVFDNGLPPADLTLNEVRDEFKPLRKGKR